MSDPFDPSNLSKLSKDQLVRIVVVLQDVVGSHSAHEAIAALEEADRIAAEPVELTDAEMVVEWLNRDGYLEPTIALSNRRVDVTFDSLKDAAAWIRAQGAAQ